MQRLLVVLLFSSFFRSYPPPATTIELGVKGAENIFALREIENSGDDLVVKLQRKLRGTNKIFPRITACVFSTYRDASGECTDSDWLEWPSSNLFDKLWITGPLPENSGKGCKVLIITVTIKANLTSHSLYDGKFIHVPNQDFRMFSFLF